MERAAARPTAFLVLPAHLEFPLLDPQVARGLGIVASYVLDERQMGSSRSTSAAGSGRRSLPSPSVRLTVGRHRLKKMLIVRIREV
jgi:hypothetical protein